MKQTDHYNIYVKKFYTLRQEVTIFYNDYFKMVHKTTYDSKHDKRVERVTPKQMLQKLPKSLAQVRAGNTSEKILNEVRQIIHYLY